MEATAIVTEEVNTDLGKDLATEVNNEVKEVTKEVTKEIKNEVTEEKPLWGVTLFSSIFSTTTDVIIPSWAELKKVIHKPAIENAVTHNDFVSLKETNNHKYLSIKGKNGVFLGGVCPYDGSKYTCKAGSTHPNPFYCLGLDFDNGIPSDFVTRFTEALKGLEFTAYTTVTSTQEIPRWRIVIPLKNGVDVETRNAIMRVIVKNIGWAGFDETGLNTKQKMALPVQLLNETVNYVEGSGEVLDAVSYLDKNYNNWREIADLPKTPKEAAEKRFIRNVKKTNLTPQEWAKKDKKRGIIGAFCKAYSCADILKESGLYTVKSNTETETRWSRVGDSGGGIVVYDTDILKCYYASDKLSGRKAMNSFTLNCILNYNEDFKAALNDAKKDEKVREVLLQRLRDLKPETAGDWGDEDAYSRGFRGVLERLVEFKHYKAVITDETKQAGYFVVFNGHRYVPVSITEIGTDIATVCNITMALNPDIDLTDYIDNNAKANTLAKNLMAMPNIKTKLTDWDADLWKINALDCVIDIKNYILTEAKKDGVTIHGWENEEAGEPFLPHNPEYLIQKTLNVSLKDYTEEGNSFLMNFLTECIPAGDTLDYMITAIGSSLGDCSKDNKFVFLLGKVGRNGKSSFINALNKTMGDYNGTASTANFLMGKRDRGGPQPELDDLRGKRIAIFSEAPAGSVLDGDYLKDWFGSPLVRTRTLNQKGGAWSPCFRGLFDCNSVPRCSDPGDQAYKSRMRIIPWDVTFMGREDPVIANKLQEDKAIHAAIIKLLLQGCYWWAENGFMLDRGIEDCPPEVRAEVGLYYEDVDDIGVFIKGNIDITENPLDFECMRALHEAYLIHGTELSLNSFSRKINRQLDIISKEKKIYRGLGKVMFTTTARGWFGIKLKTKSDSAIINEMNGVISPYAIKTMRYESVEQDAPKEEETVDLNKELEKEGPF